MSLKVLEYFHKILHFFKKYLPQPFGSVAVILIFALSANTIINTEKVYVHKTNLLIYDQGGYYGYMPAIFIHNDLEFNFYEDYGISKAPMIINLPNGKTINRYAIGPAILSTPFFLVGHFFAKRSTIHEANGMTLPYKKAVLLGCIFYVCWAFFLIRSVLLRYYKDDVVALTLIALGFGSNLLFYTAVHCMMSHAFSFFLFALLLWCTVKWISDNNYKILLLLGLTMGLIASSRLPNLVIGLIPLLWGIQNKKDILPRLQLIWNQKYWIIGALLMFVIGWSPQLIYYKIKVGSWFVDSYPNSRFWFDQPLFWRVMLSFRNGWFIYSPLMILCITGFIVVKKYCPASFWALLSHFIINMYIVSTWWCWWYGGSFGMRALIESTALLSITIAASIHYMIHKKVLKYIFILLFPALVGLSILHTHQYTKSIILFDGMSWCAYKTIFGKTHPVPVEILEKRNQCKEYNHDFYRAALDKKYRWDVCK